MVGDGQPKSVVAVGPLAWPGLDRVRGQEPADGARR